MSRPLKLFLLFSFSLLGLGGLLVTAWAFSQETYTIYEDGRMIQVQGDYEPFPEGLRAPPTTLPLDASTNPPPPPPPTQPHPTACPKNTVGARNRENHP